MYPERQLLLRVDGKVRFVTLSRPVQLMTSLIAVLMAGWVGVTSVGYFLYEDILQRRGEELGRTQNAYDNLLSEVALDRERFDTVSHSLAAAHDQILNLVEHNRNLQNNFSSMRAEFRVAQAERTHVAAQRDMVTKEAARLETEFEQALGRNAELKSGLRALEVRLATVMGDHDQVTEQRDTLSRQVQVQEHRLSELPVLRRKFETMTAERDRLHQRGAALMTQVQALEAQLAELSVMPSMLEALTAERDQLDTQRDALIANVQELELQLAEYSVLPGMLKTLTAERDQLGESRDELIARKQALETRLAELSPLPGKLKTMAEERDQVAKRRDRLIARVQVLENRLAELSILPGRVEALTAARNLLTKRRDELIGQVQALEGRLTDLAVLPGRLETVIAERNEIRDDRDQLSDRMRLLENRLAELHAAQKDVVYRLTENTAENIDKIEKTIAMTGLDVGLMLAKLPSIGGQGGPFVPVKLAQMRDAGLDENLAVLDQQIGRWEGLQTLLRSLPLSPPLDYFYVSSSFGTRRDPVNGRMAYHAGIDLVGRGRAAVFAPAPGKVTYVGWKGRYGKMIEIDHGSGVRTRYGHLRKILVKHGQKVGYRDKIGQMGSTGRSTGPHLHYEIHAGRKPRNPMHFLRAGMYVFKN